MLTAISIYNRLKAMAVIKMTLQNRITTLIIISSVIFISVFTFIQLNNQLNDLTEDNSYRANLSNIIVKNNLESVLKQAPAQELPNYLQSSLNKLQEAGVIKDALIFDKEGKIIAATETKLNGESVRFKELDKWQDLEKLEQDDKWLIPEFDKVNRRLDIYLSLKIEKDQPIAYLAKVSFSLGNIQEAFSGVYKPVILSAIFIILANILFGYLLSKEVIGPIKVLNQVTKIIADGDLSVRTNIHTQDELEELGLTFNYMTEELIKMKERAENANPLTKLPGNIVIHEQVDKRINENLKFVVIYCDLDNFKAFNDKYGIAKGDVAIKLTADIFREAANNKGNSQDFVGHEGGDDFILLTTPEKAQDVADYITKEFDKQVRSLYSQEDLTQGFIIAHARDGTVKQFPIMTISLAGVTNVHRTITSYGEVTNIAAEVKKKAKAIEGSVFVMDKRHDPPSQGPEARNNPPSANPSITPTNPA
jgi:diguanylate cyclase (GGDEF)-like protein